ncbi:MAG: family 4 glycosyl hydrolase, partial [Promethearchaeota archaeon]
MENKIVLVGAGSISFGLSMFNDLFLNKELDGSTIVLHDINKDKLEMVYELLLAENQRAKNKFKIEMTVKRKKAFIDADFIISSIEVGDRMKLWRQDYEIPRNHGSTQILGECGGPGGTLHAWRIIPPIVEIVKDAEKICPDAFFINFSNPMSRVCLAIHRTVKRLKFVGLCHQIGFLTHHLPIMFDKSIKELRLKVGGLNHFTFLLGLEDLSANTSLMSEFNKRALAYFTENENRLEFSSLTFEIFKMFGYFCYAGDNHVGEYLQFGEEFTYTPDMVEWLNIQEKAGKSIYSRFLSHHKMLKKGKYPKDGMLFNRRSGERAIPIIESIIKNRNYYEFAVNIPNDNIIDNLPQDLILECSATVNKDGVHGIKLGTIPRGIAAILRIEATIQDLCVEAVLKRSKELAITSLAVDPNVGSFEMAESIFNEMIELQKNHLPKF